MFANPAGTFTARIFARPSRARQGETWVPIDTTLAVRPDGMVVPHAAADLEFSGGGTSALAHLRLDGSDLTLRWPRPLPKPVLAGSSARYAEVLPGVDLILHATDSGFSKVLVVKSAVAAHQPELSRVRFGLTTAGLRVRTDPAGVTAAVDERGEPVLTFGAAWMWDSSGGAEPRGPGGAAAVPRDREPASGDRRALMGLELDPSGLTLVPDQALLTAPDTTYPVYLDPQWPGGRQHWLMVEQDLPTYGWWDSAYQARVGRDPDDSTTDRFRSYFQLDTSYVADKLIKKAILTFNETWRYSCIPEPVELWSAAAGGPTSNWDNKPALVRSLGSVITPRDPTDCDTVGLVEFDVKGLISDASAARLPTVTVALVSDESGGTNGAKVFDNNPYIDIEYNTVPAAPVPIGTAGVPGCSDSTPVYVNKDRPELRVRLEDADAGQPIRATVEWREVGATTVRTVDSAARVPGDEVPVIVSTTLLAGRTYEWRARAYNRDVVGEVDAGPYTGWCRFVIDKTPPSTSPVVSRVCPAACPALAVDQPTQFIFDALGDPDVAAFSYTADNTVAASRVPAVGGKATVTITPDRTDANLLVTALDRAGNLSRTTITRISAQDLAPAAALWPVDASAGGVLADARDAHPLTLYGGYSWTTAWDSSGAVALDGADNTGGHTDSSVVHTDASFTVATWVRLDDDTDWRTALGQGAARYNGFELRFDMITRSWAFLMRDADTDAAGEHVARSTSLAQVGVWTHLAGVYDHQMGELRIYVDGRLAGRSAHRSTWDATGLFGIGYRNYYGFAVSRWRGLLDDIEVYPFAASGRKVLEAMRAPNLWGSTGRWSLDGNLDDSSNAQHTLTRLGGTDWTTRRQGSDALRLNGIDGSAHTGNPVVRTDGSFSVGAWVRLDRAGATAVAVSQDGTVDSGFTLGYVNEVGWAFGKKRADVADIGVPVDRATYPAPVQTGVWTHLAGVYDKTKRQLSLYVNARLAGVVTHESSWAASGSLVLGRGRSDTSWSHFWSRGASMTSGSPARSPVRPRSGIGWPATSRSIHKDVELR